MKPMNTINWTPKAIKQAMKIKAAAMRARIFTESQALKSFPDCGNVKKLTNHACGSAITGFCSTLRAATPASFRLRR